MVTSISGVRARVVAKCFFFFFLNQSNCYRSAKLSIILTDLFVKDNMHWVVWSMRPSLKT